MILEHSQIDRMSAAGNILGWVLSLVAQKATVGASTQELDRYAYELITSAGMRPAFMGYHGYRWATCLSPNDAVVHGIPGPETLSSGDLLGIDIGIHHVDIYVDAAQTVGIGTISRADKTLLAITRQALEAGIARIRDGVHLGDVQAAIGEKIEGRGFGIVRDLSGHGIGTKLQTEPRILNLGTPGTGPILKAGMAVAIEPMVTAGDWRVKVDPDGWTVRTLDKSRAAHFEHTVLVTKTGHRVLTKIPARASISSYARVLGHRKS